MHSKEEIKKIVQQNIHQIKISEFVADGGWPLMDDVDIAVYHQEEKEGVETIRLDILYAVAKAGCCFIPGSDEFRRLSKTLTIQNNLIKFSQNE